MVYRTGAQGTLDRPTIRRAYTGSTTEGGSPQQLRYNTPRTFPVGRERTHTSLTGRRVVVPTRRGGEEAGKPPLSVPHPAEPVCSRRPSPRPYPAPVLAGGLRRAELGEKCCRRTATCQWSVPGKRS